MNSGNHMITVYLLGKKISVPDDLTIMRAMEYSGFRLIRGCGCRSGFCGACAVIYRIQGHTELRSALACQTKVTDGMCVGRLESFPINKKRYDINRLPAVNTVIGQVYPEIFHCIHCNACTKSCPQHLSVMKYIAAASRGDYASCAAESFHCVSCDICASRCPVKISHSAVGLLARRLTGKHAPVSRHLEQRIRDVEAGVYTGRLDQLKHLSVPELQRLYNDRHIEK